MGDALLLARAARRLSVALRGQDLTCPSFRSPPRLEGALRSLRWRGPGDAPLVLVRLRGRTGAEVLADMVEGVVVANRLTGERAVHCRHALWAALAPERADAARGGDGGTDLSWVAPAWWNGQTRSP